MEPIEKNKTHGKLKTRDTVIIGVGASAGGLEGLYSLFSQPVPDNTSFVVVQHLSPDFKSVTADLLARQTHQHVVAIENDMKIEGNTIYVLTERKKTEIRGGKLVLSEFDPEAINNTLDVFFNSLATEQGKKSIAIILSGGGSDGTQGAGSVRKAGGMVLVQDPETTQFDSMPSNVIEAGHAGSILAPAFMIDEINMYLEQNTLLSQFTDNDEKLLLELLDLVSQHTPMDFSNYKRPTIIRRIIRKMNQIDISSLSDYIQHLKNNPSEIDILAREFMISVTKFFRDPLAFEVLKEKVLPGIIAGKAPDDTLLKIWVVGCATGEEAYSIAILIHEHLEEIKKTMEVKIFTSDIDQEALNIASKGVYPESISNDVSEERLTKYFRKEGNTYKVKQSIRDMLIIARHDITKNPPYYKLDLISCRNLLIYLNPAIQKTILTTLHYCLNPGGYLFLGPSESIGDLKTKFKEEDKKWKIYKNTEPAIRLEHGLYSAPNLYIKPPVKAMPVLRQSKTGQADSLNEAIAETIARRTAQAGVCVDENYKILKPFGDYKKFLLPEMFNFNLLQVLPHELSVVTATGLKRAVREQKETVIKDVAFLQNETPRSVTVYIKPFSDMKSLEKVILVSFTENNPEHAAEKTELFNKELHTNRYLSDLEEELEETRKKLAEAYEALENSNVHAQSYSEELISGNEELQSTNEEVQSVNEELQTVNNQYQNKIRELAELNDDLNNYFQSTVNGQIYVDRNFIIRKFTPSAIQQVNLKESDIGRPISDISTNIRFSTMMEDIRRVALSSQKIEKEIETLDQRWYQMTLLPYVRQTNNETDGVIISFNDITDLKEAQKKLIKLNEDHNTFIYSVSHDLNAPVSNIEGLISTLRELIDKENKDEVELVELVTYSVKKLKEIIAELSDIAKIEKESFEESQEAINLNDLFKEIRSSIKGMISKSNAKISTDFKEPEIHFSKKNLRSILLNLLTNAIKYKSPEKDPEIHIHTERSGGFKILSVIDKGMGISKEDQDKLFSRFKRVDSGQDIEGTGIGLYLIKKMITNAGGKIEIESEKGKGSVFKVYFKN